MIRVKITTGSMKHGDFWNMELDYDSFDDLKEDLTDKGVTHIEGNRIIGSKTDTTEITVHARIPATIRSSAVVSAELCTFNFIEGEAA